MSFAGCWELDPHKRPKFQDILKELEKVESSGFLLTPHDSFHTLQDGWKKEIAEVLEELKLKESVSFFCKLLMNNVNIIKIHFLLLLTKGF